MTAARRTRRIVEGGWYDYPAYFEIAFQSETKREAKFILDVWNRFGSGPLRRLLEPACGGGRVMRALAQRGYELVAFDDNPKALEHLRARLCDEGTTADVISADLADFQIPAPVDLAYCFCNTFRHLLSLRSAENHLRCVAKALKPGGIYLLGMHIMPVDVDPQDEERWSASRGGVKVTTTMTVLETMSRQRKEVLRIKMDVDSPTDRFRTVCETTLRLYNVAEIRKLLGRVREFELVETYDFLYDADDPIRLDEYSSDVVFVLRKKD